MGKVQGTDVSSRVEKVDAGSRDHQEDAKKKKGKTQTQDARRKRNPNAYLGFRVFLVPLQNLL